MYNGIFSIYGCIFFFLLIKIDLRVNLQCHVSINNERRITRKYEVTFLFHKYIFYYIYVDLAGSS
jgi:hypothetical protein